MRKRMAGILGVITVAATMVGCAPSQASSQEGAARPRVTRADIDRWKTEMSNWGRWGKDDQLGALNLITPEKRKQAAGLVKEGLTVSLAHDAETQAAVDNPNPYDRKMVSLSIDRLAVSFHGYIHTHLDSLAHSNDD